MADNTYPMKGLADVYTVPYTGGDHAEEAGVHGLNSKTHMKIMLKWMRGEQMLKLFCHQAGSAKKFFHSILPEDPATEQLKIPSELKLQTQKPIIKRKKKNR